MHALISLAQQVADPAGASLVNLLSTISATGLLALIITALLRGWVVTSREFEAERRRYVDLEQASRKRIQEADDRGDEFKRIAFSLARIGEKAASAAEVRDR